MIVGSVRSGLIETRHPVVAVAVDESGAVIASLGDDLDRDFFLRSASKLLQAAVAQRNGAALGPEQLAIAASSHSAFPVHVAHVSDMLLSVGLDHQHLRCPPARPSRSTSDRLWATRGRVDKERVFHTCSGKHAAMLRACVANGWSFEYTDPDHPLQREVVAIASDTAGRSSEPIGVDGCGLPTLRSDVVGLARMFSRLVNDPEFAEVKSAASRFAPLTVDGWRPESVLARWIPCVVKGGVEGCIGLGMLEQGIAFAAKSWTGLLAPAIVGLIELMNRVGVIPDFQRSQLATTARPDVLGGGRPVGTMQPLDV
ncbi:MAG: asparaginase [Acidimicrobiia bacterium]